MSEGARKRVELELAELEHREAMLRDFINFGETFPQLTKKHQRLLLMQRRVMHNYIDVLQMRLEVWDD